MLDVKYLLEHEKATYMSGPLINTFRFPCSWGATRVLEFLDSLGVTQIVFMKNHGLGLQVTLTNAEDVQKVISGFGTK